MPMLLPVETFINGKSFHMRYWGEKTKLVIFCFIFNILGDESDHAPEITPNFAPTHVDHLKFTRTRISNDI